MQFEDFDKRIKDAAENHHPSYDQTAWTKMEKLLDEQMPVKEDGRRRIIFFWLFFLLVGGGIGWLLVDQPWKKTPTSTTALQVEDKQNKPDNNTTTGNTETKNNPGVGNVTTATDAIGTNSVPGDKTGSTQTTTSTGNVEENKTLKSDPVISRTKNTGAGNDKYGTGSGNEFSINTNPGKKGTKKKPVTQKDSPANNVSQLPTGTAKKEITPASDLVKNAPPNNSVTPAEEIILPPVKLDKQTNSEHSDTTAIKDKKSIATKEPDPVAKSKEKKKTPVKNDRALFFTVSAGPDISSVGTDRIGKIQPVFGLGLTYKFSNRWAVRSGVYTANKIYTAGPADYKSDPLPSQLYLKQIDADCKVIEIPLLVSYSFGTRKNHNWFGSAGLSSFIMKEEKYNYVYQYPGSQPFSYPWNYKNENNHYFSVLSLSAGYTKKIGNRFALTAEPYIKIPLTGIGVGNVKLNSAGVLVTFSTKILGR